MKPNDANNRFEMHELPAGAFSAWLLSVRNALLNESGIDVSCGDCKACCTSSYFIHIRPEESQTHSRIPKALLFPAPGLPKGNALLGYDENGRCPMLIDAKCSIYLHRPLTCRNYDCRVFAAAGIAAGENDKELINRQSRRWRFDYPTERDRREHAAVRDAVTFLRKHATRFPEGFVPSNPTQLAILAIRVYEVFLEQEAASDQEVVNAVMKANERFDTRTSA